MNSSFMTYREENEKLRDALEAADKRIAELERKYNESVGSFKRDLQEKLDQQRAKNKRLEAERDALKLDAERLDAIESGLCIDNQGGWEEDPPYQAYRIIGGRNDREWLISGKGWTAREAIDAAIDAAKQSEGE